MPERTPFQIPPGVVRRGSEGMSGRWYDTQLVRWTETVMRPVGGWEKIIALAPLSKIRKMHTWIDQDGVKRTALLCEKNLYILETNQITDISPVPAIVGPPDNLELGGYGDDHYSYLSYGTARPNQPQRRIIGPCYSLDNWGEDLLAMVSTDGRLLRWKPSDPPGTKAIVVPGAPTGNRLFVVTPERHVMLMQMGGNYAQFGWCDQEDVQNWAFTDLASMAGYYSIEPAGLIIAAKANRFGVLIFLPGAVYQSRYLGLPYIYSLDYVGKHAAPLTDASIVATADTLIWPAADAFWQWNGSTIQPVDCDVLDWIQRNINDRYASVTTNGLFLGSQTECWFFFPSGDSKEADKYVIYNFQEGWWAIGQLPRTCGVAGNMVDYPLMSDGYSVFRHEYGLFYYDAPELPFAQSAAINISKGARRSTLTRGIADTRAPAGDVLFYIGTSTNRIANGVPGPKLKGPKRVRDDGKIDLRVTGRDMVIRIASARNGAKPWTFGQILGQLNPRGQR
jgi:hypothetical protein